MGMPLSSMWSGEHSYLENCHCCHALLQECVPDIDVVMQMSIARLDLGVVGQGISPVLLATC